MISGFLLIIEEFKNEKLDILFNIDRAYARD